MNSSGSTEHVDFATCRIRVEQTLTDAVDGRLVASPPKSTASRRVIELPTIAVEALRDLHDEQREAGYAGRVGVPGSKRVTEAEEQSHPALLQAAVKGGGAPGYSLPLAATRREQRAARAA